MSDILSDIDGYLTRHGYRRPSPDRAVWVPSDADTATWPRAGDIALLVVDYGAPADGSDPDPDRYAYIALQWVPRARGHHHWQVASCLPVRTESWEETVWTAVMWTVLHKMSMTLSALDLGRVTDEKYQSERSQGDNNG
jgi:hypothetical protein